MTHKKLLSIFCAAMAQDIQVLLNGEPIVFDVAPATVNDRTFVPLRAIGEALGAIVDWNEEEQKVTLTREGVKNELVIGSLTARRTDADGTKEIALDAAPFTANDRTLVPVRYIAESFDMKVDWEEDTQTVRILPKQAAQSETTTSSKRKIDFSADTDGSHKAMHQEIRYDFEQHYLPGALLGDEETLIDLLENDPDLLLQTIDAIWDRAVNTHLIRMAINAEETYIINSEEDITNLLEGFRSEYMLAANDVFTAEIDTLSDGTQIILLDLADIASELPDISCSYIVLTYQKGKGLRYFTLETDSFTEGMAVCEVGLDSRGTYFFINEDKNLFLTAIEQILEQGLTPGATLTFPNKTN